MEIDEIRVIDEREQGSMGGGCWKEFLVLEKSTSLKNQKS